MCWQTFKNGSRAPLCAESPSWLVLHNSVQMELDCVPQNQQELCTLALIEYLDPSSCGSERIFLRHQLLHPLHSRGGITSEISDPHTAGYGEIIWFYG